MGLSRLWQGLMIAALLLLFWVPMGSLFVRLSSAEHFLETFFDPVVLAIAWKTAQQASMSAGLAMMVGLPLGFFLARMDRLTGASLTWVRTGLTLPFAVPSLVAALAWVDLLSVQGLFGKLEWGYSFTAVILAHVFFNVPWVAWNVLESSRQVSRVKRQALQTLGGKLWHEFWWLYWPQIKWAWLSAGAQAFVFCVTSFALVLILGGGPPVQSLETAIYYRIRFGDLDIDGAVACAFWEVFLGLTPWATVLWLRSKNALVFDREGDPTSGPIPRSITGKWAWIGIAVPFAAAWIWVLPYFGTLKALSWETLAPYWDEIVPAIWVSLQIAFGAVGGALTLGWLGVLVSRCRPYWAFVLSIPSATSVLVLGLGFFLAYGAWVDPFEGSLLAMITLQVVIFFPIVFRSLWGLFQTEEKRLKEVAMTMGASPWVSFLVIDWPTLRGPLVRNGLMVLTASLGEVAAVSLFSSESVRPVPMLMATLASRYRFEAASSLAAALLLVVLAVSMFDLRKSRRRDDASS